MKEHEVPVRCKNCQGRTYFTDNKGLCEDCSPNHGNKTNEDKE